MRRVLFPLVAATLVLVGFAPSASALTAPTASVTYPDRGRGAWPSAGTGGTLNSAGTDPGRYFKASTGTLASPGYAAYRLVAAGQPVSINDYAVHRAVLGIQTELRRRGFTASDGSALALDGLWGPKVDSAVKKFQLSAGITADGVFGPQSAKALFRPLMEQIAAAKDSAHATDLTRIMYGTISWESGWDPAAVGGATPQDLGLGQINGPAHPDMTVEDRLDPAKSLPYVAGLIDSNLVAFGYRLDEAVAAYNLGQGGARSWVKAGKPQYWPVGTTNDVWRYIDKILNPPN